MALKGIVDFVAEASSRIFMNLVVAIIILLVGFIIGRLVDRLMQRFLHEVELDNTAKRAGIHISLESVISHLAKYFIYFVAVIAALSEIGLATTVLNMVAAAVLVLLVVSFVLAIKDFMPNAAAAFFIYRKKMFAEGDRIKVERIEGRVQRIGIAETEIKTRSGDVLYVPNSAITAKAVLVKK